LTNSTEGGEGACRIVNRTISNEQKQTISETLKRRYQEHPEMYINASKAGQASKGVKRHFGFQQSSEHIGISFMKSKNRWRAYTWIDGKHKHIGLFTTEQQAIDARAHFLKGT
jgi:hypothetical protein